MNPKLLKIRYALSGGVRKAFRYAEYVAFASRFAAERSATSLPFALMEHRLPLVRKLAGVDPVLFENKKTNLRLALERMNGVILRPGQMFSFWYLVGSPSASKGYREGLALSCGEPTRSVGGGLCQLANALFWMALHSDLEVAERHHHSIDLFPDDARRVPFGTGATVVHNFKDLRLRNPTNLSFQFVFELTKDELIGSLRCSETPERRYQVIERDHRFLERPDGLYRKNSVVRQRWKNGVQESEIVLFENDSKCRYSLNDVFSREAVA
ncbi:MAG TPA: VanW family protein [bacterium]|nr:VanW family protein [bacterium]